MSSGMFMMAAQEIHVSLPAETIFTISGFPITNSMMALAAVYALVLGLFLKTARDIRTGRKSRLSAGVHWVFEILLGIIRDVMGNEKLARSVAPLAITMFFTIVFGYWIGLLPVVGAVKYNGHELFRGAITDLNFTFALAIITMLSVQIYAIKEHGVFGNMKRYVGNPFKDPIHVFEGFLEFISEFSRGIALSLRLFGNVFAGEVLILVIAILSGWLTPVSQPFFLAFELFIGVIQAYVFFMLTIVFISLGTASHHKEDDEHQQLEAAPAPLAGSKA